MTPDATARAGILVIRAWVEGGGLRARITQSRDLRGAEQLLSTTSAVDDVLNTVRKWLEVLLDDLSSAS